MNKWIVFLIVVLLLVLFLAIGGLFVLQRQYESQQAADSGWMTYQQLPGEEELVEGGALSYAVDYPADWNFLEYNTSLQGQMEEVQRLSFVAFADSALSEITRVNYRVAVTTWPIPATELALSKGLNNQVQVGSNPAWWIKQDGRLVVAMQSPYYFSVLVEAAETDEEIVGAMLSTFKFIEY